MMRDESLETEPGFDSGFEAGGPSLQEEFLELLGRGKAQAAASVLRQLESLDSETLKILALMLDGDDQGEPWLKRHHPRRIELVRWRKCRPKRWTADFRKPEAVKAVKRKLVEASMMHARPSKKKAMCEVAQEIGMSYSYVRDAWYSLHPPKESPASEID